MLPKSGQGRLSCNTLDVCMEGFWVGVLEGFNLAFLQHTLQEGDNLVQIWGAGLKRYWSGNRTGRPIKHFLCGISKSRGQPLQPDKDICRHLRITPAQSSSSLFSQAPHFLNFTRAAWVKILLKLENYFFLEISTRAVLRASWIPHPAPPNSRKRATKRVNNKQKKGAKLTNTTGNQWKTSEKNN